MIEKVRDIIYAITGYNEVSDQFIRHYIYLSIVVIIALLCTLIFKKLIVPVLKHIIEKTSIKLDDFIFTDKAFGTITHIIPALLIIAMLPLCYIGKETSSLFFIIVSRGLSIYVVVLLANLISQILHNISKYSHSEFSDSNNHYLDAIIQFISIIIYFFAGIIIIAIAINRNPTTLLAGLGAMATVLLLVFQDTILGLVAGIQLNINKMLEVGDWIEIKSKGINGYVIKHNLTTIKVKNFDNSISTIPPYKLVSETFLNWKGIQQYGSRQSRRTLNIDMASICFVTKDQIESLAQNGMIHEDINSLKLAEVTNVHLYRKHIEHYLTNHQLVDSNNWLMVRQLESTAYGMAMELYFYIKETDFVKYERISADIYEYCIAATSQFGLKMYQTMSAIQK